jgi:hypothetical protein
VQTHGFEINNYSFLIPPLSLASFGKSGMPKSPVYSFLFKDFNKNNSLNGNHHICMYMLIVIIKKNLNFFIICRYLYQVNENVMKS